MSNIGPIGGTDFPQIPPEKGKKVSSSSDEGLSVLQRAWQALKGLVSTKKPFYLISVPRNGFPQPTPPSDIEFQENLAYTAPKEVKEAQSKLSARAKGASSDKSAFGSHSTGRSSLTKTFIWLRGSIPKLRRMSSAQQKEEPSTVEDHKFTVDEFGDLLEELGNYSKGKPEVKEQIDRFQERINTLAEEFKGLAQVHERELSSVEWERFKGLIERAKAEWDRLKQDVKVYVGTLRVESVAQERFKMVAKGKVKAVWTDAERLEKVLITSLRADQQNLFKHISDHRKEAELKEEVQKAQDIQTRFRVISLEALLSSGGNSEITRRAGVLAVKILAAFRDDLIQLQNLDAAGELIEKLKEIDPDNPNIANQILGIFKAHSDELNEIIEGSSHLALNLREVDGTGPLAGRYTVETEKAEGDLENQFRAGKNPWDFSQRVLLGLQFLQGMRDLHTAGYVHGDIKPENVLVYKGGEEGEIQLKIADFGKTELIRGNQEVLYKGNLRFIAPELKLSKPGEVYGSALVMIRLLEEEFLDNQTMLSIPKKEDTKLNPDSLSDKRRGIERFLVLHKDCPQKDTSSPVGRVTSYITKGMLEKIPGKGRGLRAGNKAQEAVHKYIKALKLQLDSTYPQQAESIEDLCNLLEEMTRSDPKKRPKMQDVVESYTRILKDLN